MSQAQVGDQVKVHYTGKLDNGAVFDSSTTREPIEFRVGEGSVISGFEQAVIGMSPGETKTTTIPSERAYGSYNPQLVMVVQRPQLPPDFSVEVGQQLQIRQENGQLIPVMVTDVSESNVTLDANHPLAGQDLTFDIQLVEIK
jgi:peptidylprolyl isomerase